MLREVARLLVCVEVLSNTSYYCFCLSSRHGPSLVYQVHALPVVISPLEANVDA